MVIGDRLRGCLAQVINTKYRTVVWSGEKQDYKRSIETGATMLALAYF